MTTKGYKAFHFDMTNRYGQVFEEGKIYTTTLHPSFGIHGEGFHFCKRLEDTLRYVPGMEEEIQIARVTGLGEIASKEDHYYGYYDMYSTNRLRIDHVLTRKEILQQACNMAPHEVIRFLQGFRLTEEEILLFQLLFEGKEDVLKTISYYQEGDKSVYSEDLKSPRK